MSDATIIAFPARPEPETSTRPPAFMAGDGAFERWYDIEAVDLAGVFEELMASSDPVTFWVRAKQVRDRLNGWPIP